MLCGVGWCGVLGLSAGVPRGLCGIMENAVQGGAGLGSVHSCDLCAPSYVQGQAMLCEALRATQDLEIRENIVQLLWDLEAGNRECRLEPGARRRSLGLALCLRLCLWWWLLIGRFGIGVHTTAACPLGLVALLLLLGPWFG